MKNLTDGGARLSDAELDAAAQNNQGLGGDFAQGLRSGAYAARGQLNTLAGTGMEALGLDGSARRAASLEDQRASQEAGAGLTQLHDVQGLRSGLRYAAGTVGQIAPVAGAAIGAGLLTGGGALPALAAGTLATMPFEMGGQLQRQEADPANVDATAGQRLRAAALPALGAAAVQNIVPAGVAWRLAGRAGEASLGRIGARALADIPANAAASAGAEGIRQYGDNQLNPNAGYNPAAIQEAGIEGGAVGGMFGAVGAAGHLASKAKGAPGRAFDAAKALVPDRVSEALGGAKETAMDAADAAGDTISKVADWSKGAIKDRVADVKAWGKEFMDDPAAPDSFKAQVQDALQNPGDKAKQAWLATEKFTRDAAAATKAAVDDADVPTKLREFYQSAKDKGTALMDKMADGREIADPAAPDQPAAQAAADKSAFERAKAWAAELATEHLGPEKTAELQAAVSDLSSKVNQMTVAGLKRGQDAIKDTSAAISKFSDRVNERLAEPAADGTKKSEDYSGARKAIGDAVMGVLGPDHPAMRNAEDMNKLADGLRPFIADVASGKVLDSFSKIDHLTDLFDVTGDQTSAMLAAVHKAVSGSGKDDKTLFSTLNQIDAIYSGRQSLLETLAKNLRPELQGAVRPAELRTEADMLGEWAQKKVTEPKDAEQSKFQDAQIKRALEARYGAKAETVMAAVEANVKTEQNILETSRVKTDDEGNVLGTKDGAPSDGVREGSINDETSTVKFYHQNKQLYLDPALDKGKGGFESAAAQRMKKAQKENPDASVQFRRASEIGLDDPAVKAKHADLVDEGLSHGLDEISAKARADKEIDKYGVVTAERAKQETAINSGELKNMTLDAKRYGHSKARLDTGDHTLDAVKLTEFMGKKLKGEYTATDDLGGRFRSARMFMEGVAAVTEHTGKSFEIPDETQITRGKNPMTWGEAKKLRPATEKDAKYDEDTNRLVELRKEFAAAKTAKGKDAAREAARDIVNKREFDKLREQTADDQQRQGDDEAGFEGNVKRGGVVGKVRMREIEAELATLDNSTAKGKAREAELMEEFGRLSITRNATTDKTETDLGTGRSEIDPFGPTHDVMRGGDNPDAVIRTNSDGSARADTVMGRRKPATSVEDKGNAALDRMLTKEDFSSLDTRAKTDAFIRGARERFAHLDDKDELIGGEKEVFGQLYKMFGKGSTFDLNSLYPDFGPGVPPSPKELAAKQAAFTERARSGDKALIDTLRSSDEAKGLQRAAEHLAGLKGDGIEKTVDAINARLAELVPQPGVAYRMQTKHYSLETTKPNAERVDPQNMGPQDRRSVEDHITKVLGPKVAVYWKDILHAGEFIAGAARDVIRLSVHALNPMSVAYHESLHGFFENLRRDKHDDIIGVLEKAGGSAPVMSQLRKLLANEPAALRQLANAEERAAYMYQFYQQGKLTLGPNAANVFQRIAKFIRSVTGLWSNDERAEQIMGYFHSGEYQKMRSDPNAVHNALMEAGKSKTFEKVKAMTEPFREMGETLASAGGARLRDTGIPALRELADAMKLKTTAQGEDSGYLPNARAERSRRMNDIGTDLKPYSKEVIAEALEAMQSGTKAQSLAARTVAKMVEKRLADALTYMQDAGVKIQHLGMKDGVPYFPRAWDASYISSHQRQFQAMLDKYVQAGTLKGDPVKTMQKLMVTDGAEFGVEVDKPGMQHSKERILSFIDHADAAPFMRKDMFSILNSYMTQATRRAEWARRFGDDGAGVTALLDRAKAEGATPKQLTTAQSFVRAVDGTLGDTINPTARRMMGNVIVYQNLRLLPLAIFSSAVDSQGIIVRGGTVREAMSTFGRGMKEMVKNFQRDPKSDNMTHLAEAIGTIDNAMLIHTLGASYSQGMVGDKGRAINDTFFRLNLMEQYNTSMRVGATEAALGFIARHATKPGEHSVRFLREIGLDASDVQLDHAGRPKVLESDGLSLEHSAKMKAAVNRWVDGAILRPDAVDKAVWMSDPHYALVAHLKQFVFSFHETILKRVTHEAAHGNFAPAMALASYVPTMIAADLLKGLIQGGGQQPSWKENWGASDYVWSGMERAGLFGVGQFGIDMLADAEKGGSGIGALVGPSVEQLTDVAHVMGGRQTFGNFALKSMPANALYASALKGEATDPKFAD